MPDHYSTTLRAIAKNGEIVVTLKGGPLPKPIMHSVPAKDHKAWRELADRFYQEFGIARGDTLNVIREAVDEAKTKERDSRPAEAPVTKPASAPAETPPEPLPTATQSELDGDALPPAPTWQAYPVDTLPRPLSEFVKVAAESMCSDPSFVALPLLTACGAAIGLTRIIETKRASVNENWRVPPILWTAIIGESGSLKTPSMKLALQWLHARQTTWFKEYEAQRQQYQANRLAYEKALAEWKRAKDANEPPEEPEQPTARRILVADTTVEAIAPILQANPRGLLLARDELAGWLGNFDRYANTQGGDVAFWLSCYNAMPHTVDRRSKGTFHVPHAAVSIAGGIQPGTLQRAFTLALRENGLLARFLLTWPPRRLRIWNEHTVPESVRADVGRVFDRLLDLDFDYGSDGEPCPKIVILSPQAKAAYGRFYNRHNQELIDLTGDLAAAFSKLEEIPLRLGLILHLTRWAAGDSVNPNIIDVESMERAITLTEWHKVETTRIYEILARGAEGNQQEELVQWIAHRGGAVTVRDLVRNLWRFRGKRLEAEDALNELVKAGLGHWEEVPVDQKGGRPKAVFRLHRHIDTSTKPHKSRVSEGFVDVDVVDAPKNGVDHQDAVNPIPPESGGTNSGRSGQHQSPVVDIGELNRRLAEAAEAGGDAWVDFA